MRLLRTGCTAPYKTLYTWQHTYAVYRSLTRQLIGHAEDTQAWTNWDDLKKTYPPKGHQHMLPLHRSSFPSQFFDFFDIFVISRGCFRIPLNWKLGGAKLSLGTAAPLISVFIFCTTASPASHVTWTYSFLDRENSSSLTVLWEILSNTRQVHCVQICWRTAPSYA